MNKMKKYLMMFAALVATTVGFTACSSEDDLAGAEQEQERGVVKTQFTISIPQGTSGTTRMAAGTVQAGENYASFLGIRNIELYPFKTAISTTFPATSTSIPSQILLVGATGNGKSGPSGTSNNTIAGNGNLYEASMSHLYQDVDIPIGTRSFMFYGEALRTTETNSNTVSGSLTKTVEGATLAGITFSPTPIYSTGTVGSNGTKIAQYLTAIAATTVNNKKWEETENVGLRALYESFISNKAGSWTNVKAMVQDMYKNLKPGSADNAETTAMKNAIRTSIANSTTYGVSASEEVLAFSQDMGNYPRDLGLPDGAAYVRWNTNKEFEALANNHNTGMNITSLAQYVYPASLYYRGLSNIKTSSTPKGTGTDVYNDNKTWAQILDYYNPTEAETAAGYDNSSVSSKTRSIAIIDPVQYAVGRLDAKIKAESASLQDNALNNYTVNEGTNFKVTGILVGGQKPVDYKFEQRSDHSTFYTIYDQAIDGNIYLLNSESPTIYTLALETKTAASESDETAIAKIAVEFLNNTDKVIVGLNNEKIYPGCKFYLVGTLDPHKNLTQTYDGSTADPTNHPELIIKKAFVQDYKTIVNLKIASLKNAYNTLPDLTVPQLEMGLSVDLGWQTGISQNIDIQ